MKIGFLQRPAEIGGPGSFLVRFERELKRLGHEVVFLSEHTSETPDVILRACLKIQVEWEFNAMRAIKTY